MNLLDQRHSMTSVKKMFHSKKILLIMYIVGKVVIDTPHLSGGESPQDQGSL